MRRTMLVTGCTSGSAGHALVKEYQTRGLRVFATARRMEAMSDLEHLPNVTCITLDVTDLSSIRAAVISVQSKLGGDTLDILVNNAAIAGRSCALDQSLDDTRRMFETNLFGLIAMTQEFMPLLRLSQDPLIVNVGSVAAHLPGMTGPSYAASKAAVEAYSDALRVELRPFGIKVITTITGGILSSMARATPTPIPDNSLYAPIGDVLRTHSPVEEVTTPLGDYAQQFVDATLASSVPRHLIIAKGARIGSILSWILPLWLRESLIYNMTGLSRLPARITAQNKAK